MLSNRPKAVIISELYEHRSESTCSSVLKLLEILIQEARESNDSATVRGILRTQGEIKGYKTLQEYILRGLPGIEKSA